MRTAAEQAVLEKALVELFDVNITFNQTLGLKIHTLTAGEVTTRFYMKPNLVGHYHYGRLHGGVISAVLDSTGGVALMVALADKYKNESTQQIVQRFTKMGTIDLRIDYLRPGLGEYFDASVKVTRLGGRIASTQMALTNNLGELIATGAASYVVS
jgi:uncharacterized protein (TIGR00369 family)